MKLFPFTKATLQSFGVLLLTFLLFYFWDFKFHPILNIGIKSILITLFYLGLSYYLKLSLDINNIFNALIKRIK
jgi:hypothetical protein